MIDKTGAEKKNFPFKNHVQFNKWVGFLCKQNLCRELNERFSCPKSATDLPYVDFYI